MQILTPSNLGVDETAYIIGGFKMNKEMKYETPKFEVTKFEVDRVIMDDPNWDGDKETFTGVTMSIPETPTDIIDW